MLVVFPEIGEQKIGDQTIGRERRESGYGDPFGSRARQAALPNENISGGDLRLNHTLFMLIFAAAI
jgi:hypothetical protein